MPLEQLEYGRFTMKRLLIATALLALGTSSIALANEHCLENATHSELLRELERRLYNGGMGGSSATVSYQCDNSAYLMVSVLAPNGSEVAIREYIGMNSRCHAYAAELRQYRSRINSTTIIAICDTSAYLKRYSITPQGVLNELTKHYIGSQSRCEEEQRAINTAPTVD